MPFVAAALTLLALALAAAPAQAAEPKPPLFADLGVETVDGRQNAVAAPLPDGRVLIAGGSDNLALRSAEIFDPVGMSFEEVPHLTRYKRTGAVAAPLPDGRVLIAGGSNEVLYTHAEIFDPGTEEFTDVEGEMTAGRIEAVATPLPDGRVLIAGGFAEGEELRSAEVFDPASETFSALGQTTSSPRYGAVGVALANGETLIVGGSKPPWSVEAFDPATNAFRAISSNMTNEHSLAVGAALANGQVLIAGGYSGGIQRRWAGLLDPETGAFTYLPKEGGTQLNTERVYATAAPLPDGKVLISGGSWPDARSSAEVFVPAAALGASGNQLGTHLLGGGPVTATVLVTSLGGWDLEIDAVALHGPNAADFAILTDSCAGSTLDFKESCSIGLRFTPARLGDSAASLVFDDNEPVPTAVPLSATAVTPTVPAIPTSPASNPLPPLDPPAPRVATSVKCTAKPIRHTKLARVTCRVSPGPGAWEAKLLHRKRIVARRQVSGGPQRLTFQTARRQRGGFRLELVPLRETAHLQSGIVK